MRNIRKLSSSLCAAVASALAVVLVACIVLVSHKPPAPPPAESPPTLHYYRMTEVNLERLALNSNRPNPPSVTFSLYYKLVRSIPLKRNVTVSIGLKGTRSGYILLHLAQCRPDNPPECSEKMVDEIPVANEQALDINKMVKTKDTNMEFRISEEHGQIVYVCPVQISKGGYLIKMFVCKKIN